MSEKKKLTDLSHEELSDLITKLQIKNAQLEEECNSLSCQNSIDLANKENQIDINMDTIAKCMRILEDSKQTINRQR